MVTGMMVAEASMLAQAAATGAAVNQGEQAKAQGPGMSAALAGPGAGALVGAGVVMKGPREGMLAGTAPLPAPLQLLLIQQ